MCDVKLKYNFNLYSGKSFLPLNHKSYNCPKNIICYFRLSASRSMSILKNYSLPGLILLLLLFLNCGLEAQTQFTNFQFNIRINDVSGNENNEISPGERDFPVVATGSVEPANGRWTSQVPSTGEANREIKLYAMNTPEADKIKDIRQVSETGEADRISQNDNSHVSNTLQSTSLINFTGRLTGEKTVRIYNSSGLLLKTFNTSEDLVYIDMKALSPGHYFIRAVNLFHRVDLKMTKEF